MKIIAKLLMIICLASVLACSAKESAEDLYTDANRKLAEGNLRAAEIQAKNFVTRDTTSPKGRYLLGSIYYEMGAMGDAEAQLEKARKLGLDDSLILPLLSKVLLANGSHEKLATLPLKEVGGEALATILASKGISELSQGRQKEAELLISEALSLDPASPYISLAEVHLLAATSTDTKFEAAQKKLKSLLAENPDYAAAWRVLGTIEQKRNNLAASEAAYSKAIDNSFNKSGDLLQRALVRIQLEKYEKAQEDIDSLLKNFPKNPGAHYAQGLVHFYTKEYQEALTSFDVAAWEEDRYPSALLFSGIIHFLEGNYERAEALASQFLSKVETSDTASKLLAASRLKLRIYPGAEQAIRPVTASNPGDVQALNLLASALAHQEKTDELIDVLSQIVKLDPESPEAQLRLARGMLSEGQWEIGLDQINKVLEMDPGYQEARILLILGYLQQNKLEDALIASEEFKNSEADNITARLLAGRVYLVAGLEEEAVAEFNTVRELSPGNYGACNALAEIALKRGDSSLAYDYLEEVLVNDKDNLPALLKLSAMDGLAGNETLMLSRLQQARSAHPERVEPRVVLARYFIANDRSEDAALVLGEIGEGQRQRSDVLRATAMYQIVEKDYPGALLTLEKLQQISPDDAEIQHQLAEVYSGLNNTIKSQVHLENAVSLKPEDLQIRLAIARHYLISENKSKFDEHLKVLKELAPKNADVIQLELVASRLAGNEAESMQLAQLLFDNYPSTKHLLILAQEEWRTGNHQGAITTLENWIKKFPEDITAHLAVAAMYSLENRTESALNSYIKILEIDDSNIVALNNAAWYLRESDPARALSFAERAVALEPASINAKDTLALAQLANKEIAAAKDTISKVLAHSPDNASYRYHSIMVDVAAGELEQAAGDLEALLQEGTEFPEKPEAKRLLVRLEK